MFKLIFFVNCDGWRVDEKHGKRGYENLHYFRSIQDIKKWIALNRDCDIIRIEKISYSEYLQDVSF